MLPRQTLSLNSLHSNSSQRAIQGYLLVILSVPRTCAIQPAFTRTGNELSNHVRLLLLIATQLAQDDDDQLTHLYTGPNPQSTSENEPQISRRVSVFTLDGCLN